MHAKNPRRDESRHSQSNATGTAPTSGAGITTDSLSGPLKTALQKSAVPGLSGAAEPGNNTKGGTSRPDQINKATKPASGMKNFSGRRSGHR
ncbi:MAG: hypothetical protein K5872_16435 [Rhizobiaceae bacterium]|nr:hypothetical protein [Rhizobiaceae bacterium]MCV0407810.1 hypothetical protein [Rhizobiaceae bacterium]